MFTSWFREFARSHFAPLTPRGVRLGILPLEDRVTPATITWINPAGGTWNTDANWDLGRQPLAGDDVVIPDLGATGANVSITNAATSTQWLQSLTIWENVTTGAGVSVRLAGDLAINGGATFRVSNSYLDFDASSSATVQHVTTSGGGTIELVLGGDLSQFGTAHTVSIGAGISVTALSGGGGIGNTGGSRPAGTWTNAGDLSAVSGGTLTIGAVGGSWTNTGTISVTGGTLNLGGSFTGADVANLTNTGGTVNLTGTVTGDLTLGAAAGTWRFGGTGASLTNSTLTVDPAASFVENGNFIFDNVTIAAGSTVVASTTGSAFITVQNGLTVDGTFQVGPTSGTLGGTVHTVGTMTIGGTGTIQFGSGNWDNRISAGGSGNTLTLGPGLTLTGRSPTVRAATGTVSTGNTVVIHSAVTPTIAVASRIATLGQYGDLVTTGPIGGISGASVTIAAGNWTNSATVNIPTGATFNSGSNSWSNAGAFNLSGGTLNLNGTPTGATFGTLNQSGGTLNLNAAFAGVAGYSATGGTVYITNTLDLQGGTFTAAGDVIITGTVKNGTLAATGAGRYRIPRATGTAVLENIRLDATLSFDGGGGFSGMTIRGDFVLDGTINTTANGATVFFAGPAGGTQRITTSPGRAGTFNLTDGFLSQTLEGAAGATRTVEIGVGVTVRSGPPGGYHNAGGIQTPAAAGFRWVNKGTVVAGNSRFDITGYFENEVGGVVQADAGHTLTLYGFNADPAQRTWTNRGTLNANGGTIQLAGRFATADIGAFTRTGGAFKIIGRMDNTNATFALDDTTGTWELGSIPGVEAYILGGTLRTSGAAVFRQYVGNNVHAENVTLDGTYVLAGGNGGATLNVVGDLTLTATAVIQAYGNNGNINFSGAAGTTSRLLGNGRIDLASATMTASGGTAANRRTVEIGADITVRTTGRGYSSGASIGNSDRLSDIWVNKGTIVAFANDTDTYLWGDQFRNEGTLRIMPGARLWFGYGDGNDPNPTEWFNTGTIEINDGAGGAGGNLYLAGIVATPNIGTINRTGGGVYVAGHIYNAGATLALSASTGNWLFNRFSRVTGGQLNSTGGASFISNQDYGYGTTLNGVTLNGEWTNTNNGNTLYIDNGITINGSLYNNLPVLFLPNATNSQTVGGTGRLYNYHSAYFGLSPDNDIGVGTRQTITFGPGLQIFADGRFGGGGTNFGGVGKNVKWVFQGGITVVDNAILRLQGAEWENTGTMTVDRGGQLVFQEYGGSYRGTWRNSGTVALTGGAKLWMGGTFTNADLGTVTRVGTTEINLSGRVHNLTMTDVYGDWYFNAGSLTGTFTRTGSARLIATTANSFLDGVTLNSTLDLSAVPNSTVTVRNGLTINVSQTIGATSGATSLRMEGSQTLGGTGELVFGSVFDGVRILQTADGQVLTIGQGFTIRGTAGSIGTTGGTLINKGTIRRDTGAGQFSITFGLNGRNEGLIDTTATSTATGSRTLVSGGSTRTWTNIGTIRTSGVTLVGVQVDETWTNLGTIESLGGAVEFNGLITQAAIGYFTRSGGTVRLWSNAVLTGNLHLDDTTGSWDLTGGTLQNGTLRTSGSARLVARGTVNLTNWTLAGILDLTQANVTVFTNGTFTLTATLAVGDAAGVFTTTFDLRNTTLWTGTGGFTFSNAAHSFGGNTSVFTLDEGLTLSAHRVRFQSFTSFVNKGTILSTLAGQTVDFSLITRFTNQGVVRAVNGSTFRLDGPTLGNVSGNTLTGGTWFVGASSTLRLSGAIVTLAAALTLDGGNSNIFVGASGTTDALAGLAAVTGDGALTLSNGRTLIRTTQTMTSAGSITVGAGSTLGTVAPAQLPVTAGLLHTYLGEGNANDSTGTNTGTVEGSLAYTAGRTGVGQAFQFNGSNTGVALGAFTRQSFTIGLWVRPGSTQVQYADIFDNNHTSNTNFVLQQDSTTTNRYIWGIADGNSGGGTPFTLAADQWQYLVVTRDGATRVNRVYVNGVLVGSSTGTGDVSYSNTFLRLGRWGGGGRNWNGAMDEVHVYDRPLSAAEIAQNYAAVPFVPATLTLTGGTLTVQGQLFSGGAGTLNLAGGTLRGTGTINGSVVNTGGTVAPGSSPGFLDVTGDFVQGPGGTLELEVAGRDPNLPQYDRLRVTGTATLDGTLRLTLLDGFEPTPGDNYSVLSSALLTVQPTLRYELPAPGGANRRLAPIYGSTTLTFQTQQLPPVEFGFGTTGTTQVVAGFARVYPRQVAVDAAGNSYVSGVFTGTADFDAQHDTPGDTLTAGAPFVSAGFVAKYGPDGTLLWVYSITSTVTNPGAGAVVVDTRGNVDPTDDRIYVAGGFGPDMTYRGTTILGDPAAGSTYLLRLTPNGDLVATNRLLGVSGGAVTGSVNLYGLAVGPAGNVFAVGSYSGDADLNPDGGGSPASVGGITAVVVEYTASLGFVRSGSLTITGSFATAFDVAVAPDGAVWVVGSFEGTTGGLASVTSVGASDAFVLRLVGAGGGFTTTLARSYGGDGTDVARGIAIDAAGDVFVGGAFQFSVNFDPSPDRAFTLTSGGEDDAFILKLASDGGFRWARSAGGYRGDSTYDLATDQAGNVYATGRYSDTVDFDPLGGSYLLSNTPATNISSFIWKLTADGQLGWAVSLGGYSGANMYAYGLAVDAASRVISVGNFTGTIDLDPTAGEQLRTFNAPMGSNGALYLSQLIQKAAPVASILGLPTAAVVEGSTLTLAAGVADADSSYFTYSWSASRGGVLVATGTGPAFALTLGDQGVYTLTLTVTDESGNTDTRTATVAVTNAAPVLNATAFATPTALPNPAPAAGDTFGAVLAVGSGYVLSGVPAAAGGVGRVTQYTADGTVVRTLSVGGLPANARFGGAVTVVGGYAVVSAFGPGNTAGTVYVFDLATGTLVQTIAGPGGVAGDLFGSAVAAVGNLLAVGAPGRSDGGAAGAGVVYLFDPATGRLIQTYRNPTPQAGDGFGSALVAVGGNLLIGAPQDDSAGLNAGAAYLFDVGSGRLLRTVTNPNPTFAGSGFGGVLAASGTLAAVGAPLDDSAGTDAGGVFVYNLDPTSAAFGTLVRTVRSPNASPNSGRFGSALAFSGNRLLVGADADGTTLAASGSAFLIDADPASGTFGASLRTFKKATPAAADRFGAAVAFVGDDVLVGAPQDDAGGADAGRVYRFAATAFLTLSASTVSENGTLTVSGSFSDAGATDAHVVTIDWGNGDITRTPLPLGVATFSFEYRYLDDNPTGTASDTYSVRVRVQDDSTDLLVNQPVGGGLYNVNRYDTASGAFLGTLFTVPELDAFTKPITGPDGLVYVRVGGDVRRRDPVTGADLGVFATVGGDPGYSSSMAFGPDGTLYAAFYTGGGTPVTRVARFDRAGQPVPVPGPGVASSIYRDSGAGGQTGIYGLAVADGILYATDQTGSLRKFDLATGAPLGAVFTGAAGYVLVRDLTPSADGTLYFIAYTDSGVGPLSVVRLDLATGREVQRYVPPAAPNQYINFQFGSNDDLYLSAGTTVMYRFSVSTGELLGTFAYPGGVGGAPTGLSALPSQDATSTAVTVTNVAPAVVVRADPNPTGTSYTLRAAVTDPGTLDSVTYSWSVTGGTAVGSTTGSTFTFTPTGNNTLVTLTVTDDDLGSVTTRTQVVIGRDDPALPDAITVNNTTAVVNGTTITYATGVNAPNRVIVYARAGNDLVNASAVTAFPVELVGGAGADSLVGGTQDDWLLGDTPGGYGTSYATATDDHGNDSLAGGAGNDSLDGGLGDDTMAGGTGNDYYRQVPGSNDLLTEAGGSGIDTIDYTLAYAGITFTLGGTGPQVVDASANTVELLGTFENLTGSTYADNLSGNSLANLIAGGGGDDAVYGDARDLQFGGTRLDTLAAITGDGNDTLAGGGGSDTVYGGSGNDVIFGGDLLVSLPGTVAPVTPPASTTPDTGSNSLVGGAGNDTVVGGTGNDVIFGGDLLPPVYPGLPTLGGGTTPPGVSDSNSLVGGAGNDTVVGGTGNDIIFGGDLQTTLPAGSTPTTESNTLIGGQGSDTVVGGRGNDIIFGGDLVLNQPGSPPPTPAPDSGSNSLVGGAGNDTVVGGTGNDIIFGGDLQTTLPAGSTPTTESNTLIGGQGSDTVVGGRGNDIIFGGDLAVSLPGTTAPSAPPALDSGSNSLVGGAGNDTVVGGTGNDVIFGGDLLSTLSGSTGTGPDDNTLVGGQGSDTVVGGRGNDIIFGGDLLVTLPGAVAPVAPPAADPAPNSLVGGAGNDTVVGGTGNDVIFGGEVLPSLPGSTSSTSAEQPAPDDNTLVGGQGNDTVVGGRGNDVIFGGDLLVTLPGAVAPPSPPAPDSGSNSLVGAAGNDTVVGGTGNDIIFGGEGDDSLSGDAGTDLFEGGSGSDVIFESADASFTLTPTQLVTTPVSGSATTERFYDIEGLSLAGGAGNNVLNAAAFIGSAKLDGGAGNDTLIGTAFADHLSGGDGDDSLTGSAGADVLDTGSGTDTAAGGEGNDTYLLSLTGVQTLSDSGGIDSVDLSGVAFGVTADLAAGTVKYTPTGAVTATLGGVFENLRGTGFNDTITGNASRNILEGGGGNDVLDGGAESDTVQGGFPQVIYLDFDTGTGPGEHAYTVDERNQIQDRLEKAYSAPFSVTFTQTAPSVGRYTTVRFNAGEAEALIAGVADELDWRNANAVSDASVNINGFLGRRGQPAATSENYVGLTFTVAAHEIGHLFGLRHSDAFGPIGSGIYAGLTARVVQNEQAAAVLTGTMPFDGGTAPWVAYALKRPPVILAPVTQHGSTQANPFTPPSGVVYANGAAVATFTVDTAGTVHAQPVGAANTTVVGGYLDPNTGALVLVWSSTPPANTFALVTYQYDPFRPGYRGPANAHATPTDIMASPAAVGTTLFDAVAPTSFGVRSLIKLAFADAGATVEEGDLPTVSAPVATGNSTARNLGTLPGLAVPDLPRVNGGEAKVRATNVSGRIALAGGVSENDVYAFQGKAGDYLTVEVLSYTLRHRLSGTIDSIVRVYDAGGNLVPWFGGTAQNDDGLDNQDAILQDILLSADGVYYVVVDTFFGGSVADTDTGGYELFLYTYTPPADGAGRQGGAGDVLVGGAGRDVLVGSAGDDNFVGDLSEDVYIGYTPDQDVVGVTNTPPTATVALNTVAPRTNDTLTATATVTDPDGTPVTLTYVWRVNGEVKQTTTATSSLTDTFDLSTAGSGDRGDVITVTVTPNDGTADGQSAVTAATVANSAPTATPRTVTTDEDVTATVTLLGADVDGVDADAVQFYVTSLPTRGALYDGTHRITLAEAEAGYRVQNTLTYRPNTDANGPDLFTFRTSDGLLFSSDAAVNLAVTPVNDIPVLMDDTLSVAENSSAVADLLANDRTGPATALDETSQTLVITKLNGVAVTAGQTVATTHGGVTLLADGRVQYTPAANYNGPDSFTYEATDDGSPAASATASGLVIVNPANDAPVAADMSAQTPEDTATLIDLRPLVGDTETADADLTYTIASGPGAMHGTLTATATNGVFLFTPAADFNGPVHITFFVTDRGDPDGQSGAPGYSGPLSSAVKTVVVTVTAVNDAPVALPHAVATAEDTVAAGVLAAYDLDSPTVTFAVVGGSVVGGSVALNGATGMYTFTPAANFNGTASFRFTASDGSLTSGEQTVTVTVTAVNDAPVAATQVKSTAEDTPFTGVLVANDVDSPTLTFAVVGGSVVGGSVSLNGATGQYTFTPAADYFGPASFRFTASDGSLASGEQTVSITVSAVNDAPVTADDTAATDEDEQLILPTLGLLGNDSDVDSATLSAVLVSGPAHGTLTLAANGSFVYTPHANYHGSDSFTYRLNDGELTSNVATVTITVRPVNDAPVAANDTAATAEDTPVTVAVLANDTDIDSAALTPVVMSAPAHGVVLVNPNGTITYTPNANFAGTDTFTYIVSDGSLVSNAVTVTVTVSPVNDAPVMVSVPAASVPENQPAGTTVGLFMTADPDAGDTFTYTLVSGDGSDDNAAFAISAGHLRTAAGFNYEAKNGYTIRVRATDAGGLWVERAIGVTVTDVNEAPTALTLSGGTVAENAAADTVVGTLSTTDPDDGDSFTYQLLDDANGRFALVGGELRVVGAIDFEATPTLTAVVRVTDANGLSFDQTLTVSVTNVNEAPTFTGGGAFSVAENGTTVGRLAAADADANTALSFDLVGGADAALFAIDPLTGDLVFRNPPNFETPADADGDNAYVVLVRVSDGALSVTRTVTVTVTNVNEGPTAVALVGDTVAENTGPGTLVGTLSTTDPDAGDAFTYTLVSGAGADDNGSFTLTGNQLKTAAGFDLETKGSYTIRVRATDAGGLWVERAFTVTVTNVNEAPTALTLSNASLAENAGANAVVGTLSGIDPDAGDTLAFSLPTGVGDNGQFHLSGNTLRANASFNHEAKSSYSVTVRVTDAGGLTFDRTFTIAVTNVNEVPVAVADSFTTAEDTSVTGAVQATDVDSPTLTYSLVAGSVSNGTVTLDGATGQFTFTPAANFFGTASFQFTASDGSLTSAPQTVVVTVTPVNDAPVAADDTATTAEDTPTTVSVRDNDSDVDSSTLTVVLVTGPAHGTATVNADGTITYTPNANYNGTDTITYKVNDGALDSNVATVTVTVTPVNDTPTATVSLNTAAPRTNDTLTATATRADVDGDAVSLTYVWKVGTTVVRTLTTAALTDSLDLSAAGNGNKGDAVSVTVTPSDGSLNGTPATASATVANSTPTAADRSYSTAFDTPLVVGAPGVLTGAADADGDTLTVTANTSPAHGTVTVAADGSFTYTPTVGYSGTDSFTVTVSDGTATTTATVSLTVQAAGGQAYVSGGVLYVNGGTGVDSIQVNQSGTSVVVKINGATVGTFAPTAGIVVHGGDGHDNIVIGSDVSLPTTLYGDGGDDSLVGGAGNDLLDGGEGNDSLRALTGDDILFGGTGDDTLRAGAGNDSLSGGDGDDSLMAYTGNDSLWGGAGNDTLRGGADIDWLYGEAGDDSLVAHGGTDSLFGGAGNDTLRGGSGADTLDGGAGDDSLIGGSGIDTLIGGAGNDTLTSGSGCDIMFGGDGDDLLVGGGGVDKLDGGAGNDTLRGGSGADTLLGGLGNDLLDGQGGDDSLIGGAGNDTLLGSGGNNVLDAGDGDDVFLGWGNAFANDVLRGGSGTDKIVNPGENGGLTLGYFGLDTSVEEIAGAAGMSDQHVAGTSDGNVLNFSLTRLTHLLYVDGKGGNDAITMSGLTAGMRYRGGSGGDHFAVTAAAAGTEQTVDEFRTGTDKIDLRALGLTSSAVSFVRDGADCLVRICLPNGQFITLRLRTFTGTPPWSDFLF